MCLVCLCCVYVVLCVVFGLCVCVCVLYVCFFGVCGFLILLYFIIIITAC